MPVDLTDHPQAGWAVLPDPRSSSLTDWLSFRAPVTILTAKSPDEVPLLLDEVDAAGARGLWAVGYVSYEAAKAFRSYWSTHPPIETLPLAWFALYDTPVTGMTPPVDVGLENPANLEWRYTWEPDEFADKVECIKEYIAQGDTYQVNLTTSLWAETKGHPWQLFQALRSRQPTPTQCYLDMGSHVLCSASPELFFRRSENEILCRPMKGTAPRGSDAALDARLRLELTNSPKNRAENLMITDMVRNDLGILAEPGSVSADPLFSVESYPTVHQMTSTVRAHSHASLRDLFFALFPCASITGAPKRRTMEIIQELEDAPRGVYTGAIGVVEPGGLCQFNVAIRTVLWDRSSQRCHYGTGCGIVWDSDAQAEEQEARSKAAILFDHVLPAKLLETMRWEAERGVELLPWHLRRLRSSATEMGYPYIETDIRRAINEACEAAPSDMLRLRLTLDIDGKVAVSRSALDLHEAQKQRVFAFDSHRTSSQHPELRHKSTRRGIYDDALARFSGLDDVLLINERGECMEFSIGNLVVELDGQMRTPSLTSGCLQGTQRQRLLEEGKLTEKILSPSDVKRATAIYCSNAVRGLVPMRLQTKEIK